MAQRAAAIAAGTGGTAADAHASRRCRVVAVVIMQVAVDVASIAAPVQVAPGAPWVAQACHAAWALVWVLQHALVGSLVCRMVGRQRVRSCTLLEYMHWAAGHIALWQACLLTRVWAQVALLAVTGVFALQACLCVLQFAVVLSLLACDVIARDAAGWEEPRSALQPDVASWRHRLHRNCNIVAPAA